MKMNVFGILIVNGQLSKNQLIMFRYLEDNSIPIRIQATLIIWISGSQAFLLSDPPKDSLQLP